MPDRASGVRLKLKDPHKEQYAERWECMCEVRRRLRVISVYRSKQYYKQRKKFSCAALNMAMRQFFAILIACSAVFQQWLFGRTISTVACSVSRSSCVSLDTSLLRQWNFGLYLRAVIYEYNSSYVDSSLLPSFLFNGLYRIVFVSQT